MTQIVFRVSICCNNSRHFKITDFGLSTQCLPIQRHPDLGSIRKAEGFGWKAANQVIKFNGNTLNELSRERLQEVSLTSFLGSRK
jgi:hypothetical protein